MTTVHGPSHVPGLAGVVASPSQYAHVASFRTDTATTFAAASTDSTASSSLSHWSPTILPTAAPAMGAEIPQITPSLSPGLRPAKTLTMGVSALMGPPASPSLGAAAVAPPGTAVPAVASASPPFNPNLSPLQQPISRISPSVSNQSMSPDLNSVDMPVMLPPPATMVDQLPVSSAFATAISLASVNGEHSMDTTPQPVDSSTGHSTPGAPSPGPQSMVFDGVPVDQQQQHLHHHGAAVQSPAQSPSPNTVSIAFSPTQLTRLSDQNVEPLQLPNPHMFPGVYPYATFDMSSQRRFITPSMHALKQPKLCKPAAPRNKPAKANARAQGRKGANANGEKPTRRFCHICRSPKEVAKIVSCCSGKQSHVFCAGCVHRRLKLSFEELVQRNDWLCPKCENRCPCSKCRKRIPVVPPAPPQTL